MSVLDDIGAWLKASPYDPGGLLANSCEAGGWCVTDPVTKPVGDALKQGEDFAVQLAAWGAVGLVAVLLVRKVS